MSLTDPPVFQFTERNQARLTLRSPEGHVAHTVAPERDIIGVTVLSQGKLNFPRSSAIAALTWAGV